MVRGAPHQITDFGVTFRRILAPIGHFLGVSLVTLGLVQPALAHPHIMIDAKVDIRFDGEGRIASLHHSWTFDTAFSVWMVQGLDTNGDGTVSGEELQPLADENMVGLAEYDFYTFAGDGMEFVASGDQRMRYEDNQVTLDFTIDAVAPQAPGGRFELGVYDAEYYVAIAFKNPTDIRLVDAPQSCGTVLLPPRPMDQATEEKLYALGPEVLELPPELAAAMRGTQGMIIVSCGVALAPANALEAVEQVAQARPATPFGGPPAEPGLNLPRTGFFGWLQEQQRVFYGAMTGALDAMRSDWTAFWTLGGISFLYGVFHAAGPGHGKVVISSYVLANERQLRQGVALSAISALLQSLVAIGFVLVLAGILHMTSAAMGDAAHWVGVLSYAMVAVLGGWLVLRKIFGWGHHHHGNEHHHHHHEGCEHHHHHDHDDGHMHHAIAPSALGGSWREKLGVVLAVGLRPCSGALVVMVFSLSQGMVAAGVVSVLLMGLGTAITVATLASIAVGAKNLAGRLGGASGALAASIMWWAELVGAVLVLLFGLLLLAASL
jgi:nickel/cobalt exporter